MKKLISAALLAAPLVFVSAAWAQDRHEGHEGGDHPHEGGAPPAPHPGPQGGPPHGGGRGGGGGHFDRGAPPQAPRPQPQPPAQPRPAAPQAMTPRPQAQGGNRGDFHGNRPGPGNAPGNPPGRPGAPNGGGQRHDYSGFRNYHQAFNAPRRFRAPAYRQPPGWTYRRWSFGQILPSLFWRQDYWLSDYQDYALPPPPYGAVWVRYGSDAILVDQGSGEIITVEYGVFY